MKISRHTEKALSLLLALCLAVPLCAPLSARAAAEGVGYLPGVTEEMTRPAFWTAGMDDPDALLATPEEIAAINAAALSTEGTNMNDLKNLPEVFDGVALSASLQASAAAEAADYLGWTYDETGRKLEQADFDRFIANCADPNPFREMKPRYGIAVQRTILLTFPYDGQILDDPVDFDFDYQAQYTLRVNEPAVLLTTSNDGAFYQVCTSCYSGWARAEDIAICKDRAEWLSAWDIPAEKRLMFYGDKMYTDYSKTAPETAARLITMGTVLERMDEQEAGALVINRLPLHNYAVYLPVRNEDGSYAKVPALINARERLSEDYLPLTGRNLADLALISLGDAYGWGGSLNNEDCGSLNRSIFCCFGLYLPDNGTRQWPLAMPKLDATYLSAEEKLAVLDEMPLGTLLTFPGHQMMYLGKSDGGYYVVSAVSSILGPATGKRQRTRDVQINALDLRRANGMTWLQALNHIYLPWQSLAPGAESGMPALPWYHAGTAYCLEQGWIDALDGGYFRPDEAAPRGVAVEALWRMAGKPEVSGENFPDVESGASYETAALWAKARGIVGGVDGALCADAALTREQLAVMLYRAGAAEEDAAAAGIAAYADAGEVSVWARDAMAWAVREQLITGKSAETLDPRDAVTRAELAVILQRAGCAESFSLSPRDDAAS